MSPFLLDVNVLIALVCEGHVAHAKVKRWFRQTGAKRWATCPLTEAGFVRVVSNPRFSEHLPDLNEALEMLRIVTALDGHRFYPLDLGLLDAVTPVAERLFGHQQVTDAYLLGMAIKSKATLVTLDRGIEDLAGSEFHSHVLVLD
jgi:toxin-antitoxin system PIN domain toxin